MARRKKTPIAFIIQQIEEMVCEASGLLCEQIEARLPELIVEAFGLPTGDDAIADHVTRLVEKAGTGRKPRKKKVPVKKRGPGRPKGSKNKKKRTTKKRAVKKASPGKWANGTDASYSDLRRRITEQRA